MNRASWNPPHDKLTPNKPECSVTVHPDYDVRQGLKPHQCPFNGQMEFEGKLYCRRHHPIAQAERIAWRWYKLIEELVKLGFKVMTQSDFDAMIRQYDASAAHMQKQLTEAGWTMQNQRQELEQYYYSERRPGYGEMGG